MDLRNLTELYLPDLSGYILPTGTENVSTGYNNANNESQIFDTTTQPREEVYQENVYRDLDGFAIPVVPPERAMQSNRPAFAPNKVTIAPREVSSMSEIVRSVRRCRYCDGWQGDKEHMFSVHALEFPCLDKNCDRVLGSFYGRFMHMLTHREWQCRCCNTGFHSYAGVRRHMLESDCSCCQLCGRKFRLVYSLINHERVCEGHDVPKKAGCELCPRVFGDRDDLREHMGTVHAVVRFGVGRASKWAKKKGKSTCAQ